MPDEPVPSKVILYCGRDCDSFERLVRRMAGDAPVTAERRGLTFTHPRAQLHYRPAFTVGAALSVLESEYVNLVLIDLRSDADERILEKRMQHARRLLTELDDVEDPETRYGFHRILVLVSSADGARVDRLLVDLGGFGIRHVCKERPEGIEPAFGNCVVDDALKLMLDREPKKVALCAAGGGTTAIFFELGALKCLDDCLVAADGTRGAVNDFDMYFGISAGAVVASLLANGYSAEEFMAGLAGAEGGRVPPIDLSLVRLGHLNVGGFARRIADLGGKSAAAIFDALRGRGMPTVDGMFLEATAAVGAPFRSDRFEEVVRNILTSNGATNDFRHLRRELYVGASNQDSRRHMLFGDQAPETPISLAVQASLSINPAFSAVEIDGAWYEDGAVTRTSNFVEAINRGANLIFVLDPFVPYVSNEPGFSNRRGMLFNIAQDVRSLSFTRYENARDWALRRHPEVSSYTFLPNNRLRKLLSTNPMDHRPYMEIFSAAYIGTLNRIKMIQHRLSGDVTVHGLTLNLEAADAIADRLAATSAPKFEDFFVDRRVEMRRPRLSLER